jgi:hypothetical protein
MPRTESYVPKTNLFGLNVPLFERYFGYKAVGPQEPGAGTSSHRRVRRTCLNFLLLYAPRALLRHLSLHA